MTYEPQTDSLKIPTKDAQRAALSMRYVIRTIREMAGLPLEGYEWHKPLEAAQHAELGVLSVARSFGIDLGADDSGKLDVRDAR